PMAERMVQEFGNSIYECYETATCTELESDVCFEDSMASCTTNYDATVETMCSVMIECENEQPASQQDIDTCVSMMIDDEDVAIYACFTEAALGNFETCLEDGPCSETLMDDCMESELGIMTVVEEPMK
ncbi:hypothetical protein KKF84_19860, partial [Myxococcota bacterium]|nr:hypothetical protein [Myxococcota bacterium]